MFTTALYAAHETGRALLRPFSSWTAAQSAFFGTDGPGERWPLARDWAAACELVHRLSKSYPKPEFGIGATPCAGGLAAVSETVIHREAFCTLRRFERSDAPVATPTILLVAPMSGHHATLLRDTVRALVGRHHVIITDWSDAREVPLSEGPFTLDGYVNAVRRFLRLLGPERVHVMAVCQPTVPVLAAVALMAQSGEPVPRSLTLLGGPVDPAANPTRVCELAWNHPLSWFDANLVHTVPWPYAGAGRRVYPGFLQHLGFVAMNPGRHWRSHEEFFMHLTRGDTHDAQSHRRFYDEYNAVADLPADYYLQTVRTVFQDRALATGNWDVDGVRVQPQAIADTALLTLEGELDDISAPGQTAAAHRLCSGIPQKRHAHHVISGVGHYGLFSGSAWRERVCPLVGDFVAACEQRVSSGDARAATKRIRTDGLRRA